MHPPGHACGRPYLEVGFRGENNCNIFRLFCSGFRYFSQNFVTVLSQLGSRQVTTDHITRSPNNPPDKTSLGHRLIIFVVVRGSVRVRNPSHGSDRVRSRPMG